MAASSAPNEIDPVARPNLYHESMQEIWCLIDDLRGGTSAMRAAGSKWLPMETLERSANYATRLSRSFLFAALDDTIEKVVAKPFARDVVVSIEEGEEMPAPFEQIIRDSDGTGRDLTAFSREIFDLAVQDGKVHVLVDYPKIPEGSTREAQIGKRPTFVPIPARNMLGWKSEVRDGIEVLTQVRFLEPHIEDDGDYNEVCVNYIRVITETTWELHKEVVEVQGGNRTVKWVEDSRGNHSFKSVPVFTVYTNRTGFMQAEPPLEKLAWENLAHWQSYSDQRNCLRFARVGILFGAGFSDEQVEKGVVVGPNSMVATTNAQAKMMYVEHSGRAIEAGRVDLKDNEERMVILGLQPYMKQTGRVTATGQAIDESRNQALVHAWVRALETGLFQMFEAASKWLGITMPLNFAVDVNTDFGLSPRASDDIEALIKMRENGEISRPTFLQEIKRRAIVAEHVDIAAEVKAIEKEEKEEADRKAAEDAANRNDGSAQNPPATKQVGSSASGS